MTTLYVAFDGFRCHIWHDHTYVLIISKYLFNSSIDNFITTLEDF